jgi:hypothetical protein
VKVRVGGDARKHRIGNAHILAALMNAELVDVIGDQARYIGPDDRGVELELILVPDDRNPDAFTIIHAMPTGFRERRTDG